MAHPDNVAHIDIRFPVNFSLIVTGILITLTVGFWFVTQDWRETFMFFAIGAAAGAQVTTTFFTARLLGMHIKSREDEKEREKLANEREERRAAREKAHDDFILRREAARFGERWNDPGLADARNTMEELRRRRFDSEKLLSFIRENEKAVTHVINLVEEIATCCKHHLVDTSLMRRQFDFVVFNTWECLSSWVYEVRKECGEPGIWEDTEWLYRSWKDT